MKTTIEDIVATGDRVVVRATWRGTHTGTMFGHPPTGVVVQTTNIVIYRLVDGRVAEAWEEWDYAGWLRQLAGDEAA